MAKKQTRRSISVSRVTYERLKSFCETNQISMSQLVETRVNDFLGPNDLAPVVSMTPSTPIRPLPARPAVTAPVAAPIAVPMAKAAEARTVSGISSAAPAVAQPLSQPASAQPAPMTSAAARFIVEPPMPIIKPRQDTAAPKPAEKRPDQIFTF